MKFCSSLFASDENRDITIEPDRHLSKTPPSDCCTGSDEKLNCIATFVDDSDNVFLEEKPPLKKLKIKIITPKSKKTCESIDTEAIQIS